MKNGDQRAFPLPSSLVKSLMDTVEHISADRQEAVGEIIADRSSGMTLHQYYAAKAMQGLLAGGVKAPPHFVEDYDAIVRMSHRLAAEMIKGDPK